MKSTLIFSLLSPVLAFPPWLMERGFEGDELRELSRVAARIELEALNQKRSTGIEKRAFDADKQYVSTSGEHEFMAPGPDDLRGPCPGLNAMANHAYLPRDGVATISQFVQGTYEAFGMGVDLSTFLGIYGAVFDGDLTKWSIGGAPPAGLLSSVGLLGKPQGISGSHNNYEGDNSPVKGDLYEYGDNVHVQLSQFEDLYNQPLGDNGYDIPVITKFRAERFQQSINNNAHFFNAPFAGVLASPAAYSFIYRFMANKSEEYPEGYLNGDILKTFYSVSGEPGSFVYTPGHERFPENWYKRAIGDEYTIPFFARDQLYQALQHPQFLDIGGNTDGPNTFTGVDLADLTGGVYNAKNLLEGNNLACFGMQLGQAAAPDILNGLFSSLTQPLKQLAGAVGDATASLSCPELKAVDTSSFSKYPGAEGAY